MAEIVGILNLTPDSFSDGGKYNATDTALARIEELFEQGADMVDIGAESTRPGAGDVVIEQEWTRLRPVLHRIAKAYSVDKFSIDTRHSEIARRAATTFFGEVTINDVTGLSDSKMIDVVANHALRLVIGHLPRIANGSVRAAHSGEKMTCEWQVRDELITTYLKAVQGGVIPERIILDPGIGFGKTHELSKKLLGFGALVPSVPVMIGYSRKRFLGDDRMNPEVNLEAARIALLTGANYLRVHDVREHKQLSESINNQND